ncbi:MAG: Dam family site-specific DNA-(adenine-N6)-methyltransferase [Legionellales bacterium]|nr:Dam family site-specific DNA-(adenine-N6)-methyltransferase [Legionellales bacterium]
MKKNKPFLKWAGNKYRCLHHILPALPPANRLIEPFTGSGAVFLNADYSHYLLAEENDDLIILFQHLKSEGDSFISYCKSFFCPENNSQAAFNRLREQFNRDPDKRLRAALFLYLNRHGYNGLCRYNQSGVYNVPFGRYAKPYFPLAEMHFFHQKSQRTIFVQGDFRATFAKATNGDLIYCDPPYAPLIQSSNFSAYTPNKFGEPEQILLAELAMTYAKKGVTVVISNHDTQFTRHHYREALITSFPVSRLISCNIDQRVPVVELLAVFQGAL